MSPEVTPTKSGKGAMVVIPESPERKAARPAQRDAAAREALEQLRAARGESGRRTE